MLAAVDLRSGYGSTQVLHGISLTVAGGEIVALLGRNGVGKTTLVKTLSGVLPASAGRVTIDGVDVTRRPPSHRVGLGLRATYQERGVFAELTVADNLRLHGIAPSEEDRILETFPGWLSDRRSQLAGTLSGGEQKMLAAAIALSSDAGILVLDEPTEGLQPTNVDVLGSLLDAARSAGRGVLLVEQHVALATRLADRFLLAEKGEIVDRGDAAEPDIRQRISDRLAL
ncbi:MAG: ATP-binding cassette domain-containing protein [Actinomycetota bacterium]